MVNKKELPTEVLEIIKSILDKDPGEITTEEHAFLMARRSYLSASEKEEFGIEEPKSSKKVKAEEIKKEVTEVEEEEVESI